MNYKTLRFTDGKVVAKVGDKITEMQITGDTQEGEVVAVGPRSVEVKFVDGYLRLPKVWTSNGPIKGMCQYHLLRAEA